MNSFINGMLKKSKLIIVLAIILFSVSLFFVFQVKINANTADYLPDQSEAKQGLVLFENEFPTLSQNNSAKILIRDHTIEEVLALKNEIKAINGVQRVIWLDDYVDLTQVPIEYVPENVKINFIHENYDLLTITFTNTLDSQSTQVSIQVIDQLINGSGGVGLINTTSTDVAFLATVLGMIIIIIIIVLFTDSYFASLFVLITLGLAIIINLGTNMIFGEISNISLMATAIIQLAVSIDYSLIFLKNFRIAKEKEVDLNTAIIQATKTSFKTILASALTTVAGFLALSIMNYRIGSELGLILAKGVLISLIVVLCLLPVFMKLGYPLIVKTSHKSILPSFTRTSKFIGSKFSLPILLVFIALAGFGIYGQMNNQFIYTDNQVQHTSIDDEIITNFGENNNFILLVPKGEKANELALVHDLQQLDNVQSISDIYVVAGTSTPEEMIPQEIQAQFWSEHYSLIVITMNLPTESQATFNTVEKIRDISHTYYDSSYLTGQSAIINDIKTSINQDYLKVMIISILLIALIIFLTFRSFTLPILLIILIESAIWINMSVPYYTGVTLSFLGYILINSIQLGATIDYAIIITEHYEEERRTFPAVEAARRAFTFSVNSILISMSALSIAGFLLSMIIDMDIIKELGVLLGRGTLISGFISLIILPILLIFFDKFISKTYFGKKKLATHLDVKDQA